MSSARIYPDPILAQVCEHSTKRPPSKSKKIESILCSATELSLTARRVYRIWIDTPDERRIAIRLDESAASLLSQHLINLLNKSEEI